MSTTDTTAPAAAASAAPASNAPTDGITAPVLLHMAAEAGADLTENGQPAKDFWGKGMRIGGRYVTTDRKTGKKVDFVATPELAGHLLSSWERMKEKGVRVPYCRDHVVNAETTLGRMIDLKREGDWLKPKIRAVGDDAIRIAARNEISLGIKPNFEDGTGERFSAAIWHVGATPIPVVPSQDGLIAAAREGADDGSLVFSLETPDLTLPTETQGAPASVRGTGSAIETPAAGTVQGAPVTPAAGKATPMESPFTPELRKKVVGRLADPEKDAALHAELSKADDATLLSRFVEDHDKQCTDLAAWLPYAKAQEAAVQVNLSRAEEAEEKLTSAEARAVELARTATEASELTPREILLSREGEGVLSERYMRLAEKADRLLSAGYSPASVNSLKGALIGSEESFNVFNLSREDGSAPCAADAVLDVLLSMKPDAPKPGEATVLPQVDLARGGGKTGGADPKEVDEMRRLQGLPPKKA